MASDFSSEERFDRLSHLLGNSIIGGVWVYASSEEGVIRASLDVLPSVVHAMGIGTTRYLMVIISSTYQYIQSERLHEGNHSATRILH